MSPSTALELGATGQVAQLVEQRTENPRVGGSIPSLAMQFIEENRTERPGSSRALRFFVRVSSRVKLRELMDSRLRGEADEHTLPHQTARATVSFSASSDGRSPKLDQSDGRAVVRRPLGLPMSLRGVHSRAAQWPVGLATAFATPPPAAWRLWTSSATSSRPHFLQFTYAAELRACAPWKEMREQLGLHDRLGVGRRARR
jgi:hypothetical protein